jgi:hypothetical protein
MTLSTNTTYRVLVEKLGSAEANQFIGNAGEVFYNPSVPVLKLSDGSTVGGVPIASIIQSDSIGLGTDTVGDYVKSITGTANQITVTNGSGEGSTPVISIPNQFSVGIVSASQITSSGDVSIAGTTRIVGFVETQSTSSVSSNILSLNANNGTVFTHTTSSQIGIVSFTGISTQSANCQTFTVLVTQGNTPVNVTPQTGIGTQLATIVTTGGTGISTHIKVGVGNTITLTNSVGALDILTFIVSYNGAGIASTNFTVIGFASTQFRGVI